MTDSDARPSGEIETYAKPEMGEWVRERDLPLGWIADNIDAPEEWSVEFVDRGSCLRIRNKEIDRERYGVRPPGWPGVGITSGRDYWSVIGDTNRVIRECDLWYDPDEDSPEDIIHGVEDAIKNVQEDLERCRLSSMLDDAVPETVVENLIDRFGTAERVVEIEDDTPLLESVNGVGPKRREAIQQRFMLLKMSDKELVSP